MLSKALYAILGWAMLTLLVTLLTWQFVVGPVMIQFHNLGK